MHASYFGAYQRATPINDIGGCLIRKWSSGSVSDRGSPQKEAARARDRSQSR
jgi:hypothetical protein